MMSSLPVPVYLETAKTRVFAVVPAWPGWCRGGRSADAALQALVDYVPRYVLALRGAGLAFPSINSVADLQVVASLPGNAVTEFGAPDRPLPGDELPVDAPELERMRAILHAAWQAFDRAVAAAQGKSLRTGPRGGGRSLEKMIAHNNGAEEAYLTALGGKAKPGTSDADLRLVMLDTLAASVRGEIPALGPRGGKRWSPRFFVRRVAWHALDHAWELEDRVQ
jgi:hypothetical protein